MSVRRVISFLAQRLPVVLGITGALLPIVSRNVAILLWSPQHFPMVFGCRGELALGIMGAASFCAAAYLCPVRISGISGISAYELCRLVIPVVIMVVITGGVHGICAVGSFGVGSTPGRSTAVIGFFFAPIWGLVAFIAGYLATTLIMCVWRLANRTPSAMDDQ